MLVSLSFEGELPESLDLGFMGLSTQFLECKKRILPRVPQFGTESIVTFVKLNF
jgi:hypothetical protein